MLHGIRVPLPATASADLGEIIHLDSALCEKYGKKLTVQPSLSRQVVSFQASKDRPKYRWYKFKEAFSASLVEYLVRNIGPVSGKLFDPFAGSGTSLFAATECGLDADGIELLPIGHQIINARQLLDSQFGYEDLAGLEKWHISMPWKNVEGGVKVNELRITAGAYPPETLEEIERFVAATEHETTKLAAILLFALLCILEKISYTRKDGQYLRWDYRSNRRQGGKPFNKGKIYGFDEAICTKLREICSDVRGSLSPGGLFPGENRKGHINLYRGSCLDLMPMLTKELYDGIITSPPYCNRYDYTRTYALELALLGADEDAISRLRQEMLSCTVENRVKGLRSLNPKWDEAISAADRQSLLQSILKYLDKQKSLHLLNNDGIPRMVRGYFYEMACVIAECARVLKPNAPLFMVNDNVRYAGASISVDLILSDIAEKLGFRVENIFVLPEGKGNSSQQMGQHGRDVLRKCVYFWRRVQ